MAAERTPAVILGAAGYVGAELLRLIALHPRFELAHAVSESKPGSSIAAAFPHLAPSHGDACFSSVSAAQAVLERGAQVALFSALPHGESAPRILEWMKLAEERGAELRIVDISADLRLGDPALHAKVYGKPHPAPELLERAVCALPELVRGVPSKLIAHPGCFTTAVTLACRPLQALGLSAGPYFASAITGSTGSGREPVAATHHPWRHGNMRAYSPFAHRHEPEMQRLIGADGPKPEVLFVPTSGPFARGIHATVHVTLREPMTGAALREQLKAFWSGMPFIRVEDAPPALKDVVGTNCCRITAEARGCEAVIISVIDNLTKGAAGGAVQWMNRLFEVPDTTGLLIPGPGWN